MSAGRFGWTDEVMAPLGSFGGRRQWLGADAHAYNRIFEAVESIGEERGRALVQAIADSLDRAAGMSPAATAKPAGSHPPAPQPARRTLPGPIPSARVAPR